VTSVDAGGRNGRPRAGARARSRLGRRAAVLGPEALPRARRFRPPTSEPTVFDGDDLRAIKGLGTVAADKLRGAGITTWAQIAAWTPDEAQEIAARLNLQAGRIASDDWVGQAQRLVKERGGS